MLSSVPMSSIAQELDESLRKLDPETAQRVEHLVREALALAGRAPMAKDALGYPSGYFEATAGSFAGEPLDRPASLPPEKRTAW